MMKRIGFLYEKIVTMENLELAHKNARRGKSKFSEVQYVDNNKEECLLQIQKMLIDGTYVVSNYDIFYKNEGGKERKLQKLPYYPDRIIQWQIIQVIGEIFTKSFIYDTYSSIKGRGIHLAARRVQKFLKLNKKDKLYCLKLDIKKYYFSIDKDILKGMLYKKFKDKKLLNLLELIIDSYDEGIPIGNFLSQYFANFYLNNLDRRIKEVLKIKGYFRYMDDLVIVHKNKKFLHYILKDIKWFCKEKLNLEVKSNYQIFPIDSRGIDFVGYVIYVNRIKIRKRIKSNMIKKIKFRNFKGEPSYNGWLVGCNCNILRIKYNIKRGGKNEKGTIFTRAELI